MLSDGDLILRPLRLRDRKRWDEVRAANREWLTPWEATRPVVSGEEETKALPSYFEMVAQHRSDGRNGRAYSLAIWLREGRSERFVGQITLGGVVFGALRGAHIGYWIDGRCANRGLTTKAVNLLSNFAFESLGIHRIEINVRPENAASKRVAEKCGYTFESIRPRFLHIDGAWRDHLTYVKENSKVL